MDTLARQSLQKGQLIPGAPARPPQFRPDFHWHGACERKSGTKFWPQVEMPVDEAYYREAGDAFALPDGRKPRPSRLVPRNASGRPNLLDDARAVAAAERRIAALEARIAYLESQVTTDELTGLLNRRGFIDAF